VGFPVFILALIPVRALILPRWLTPRELAILDGPTASPFTMESVSGTYGAGSAVLDAAGSGGESSGRDASASGGVLTTGSDAVASREELAELAELGEVRRSREGRKSKSSAAWEGAGAVELPSIRARKGLGGEE